MSRLFGFWFFPFALIILNLSCTTDDAIPVRKKAPVYSESRHYPFEDFFLQQFFPEPAPDLLALEAAFQQIKQKEIYRNAPDGFDADWITQGPGNLGARINTTAVHPLDEQIIYAGFANGGVFKTTDGGEHWRPIFDGQNFLAIGDITLDPNDPETIYVGTGDPNISGYPSIGDGLYRSTDGGESWTHLGLREQRIISKVIVDPQDSQTIYVATMGLPFERNRQRGLYKTVDGGDHWNQILFLSEQTGVIDLLLDPANPKILYAAGWDRIRNNKESIVRGPGAHIYKTMDGGLSWVRLQGGLPQGSHTRIGLAMSGLNTETIFALYIDNELEDPCKDSGYNVKGIFKSTDGGSNWTTIPSYAEDGENTLPCNALGGFGWYFGKIAVNPNDDNDLFLLGVDLWRTRDSGRSWGRATPNWWEYQVHADKHDLVFCPSGSILLATDGGLYRTDLENEQWDDIENIPATQFYRVAYNPTRPRQYYGGAQDNGTSGGNRESINEWDRIYGADGFQTVFHPENPDIFYVETQRGGIRATLDGGENWSSGTRGIHSEDSRNWDMPYLMSRFDPHILYAGTDRVYRSISDSLPQWTVISPRLTEVENDFRDHNISALAESPVHPDILYAATTDAQLWTTRDGGAEWIRISESLPYRYISDVVASPHETHTVYVSHSGYKDNDNTPLLHRSNNGGHSWISIAGDLPSIGINEILVIPQTNDLAIFVATDAGVYGTIDGGGQWHRLGSNMPMIPVYDLVWNEMENQLVAATFARGIVSFELSLMHLEDVVSTGLDVPNSDALNFSAFPNPTNSGVWLDFDKRLPTGPLKLMLYDAGGILVRQEKVAEVKAGKIYMDLSRIPSGVFFLTVQQGQNILSQKIAITD